MPFRTTLFRAASVATAGLLALPATPAVAADTTVVDVLKVVDGEYVVETVSVPARSAEAAADSLEDRADVVAASPQVVYELEAGYDPYWDTSDPQATSRVRDAWSRTRGEGQVVAVLDSAAEIQHEDLFGAVLPGADMVGTGGSGWHGYGVAGVVAARAENGVGSAGMAPAAKVLPVRVCDTGCPSNAIARGILWAADHGADVINMSLSGVGYSDVTAAAVQYALDKGISVVAAAGNDGLNGNPVMYPAALSGVIAVSSTTPAGLVSDWAVHGWQADLSTVGESVLLTMPGNGYGAGSGTSFASPAVAGAVALLRASHPGITPVEVQAALQAGSDGSGTWDRAYGAGRMDVPGAMAAADRAAAGVVATGASGAVDVSWDAVPGTTTYTVRVDGAVRASVTGTSTSISGLTNGIQVAVDVQADAGSRSRPVLATVAPTAPAVPTLHSATLSGTASSATLALSASVTGAVAPRYAILRDGVSIGTLAMALGTTPKTTNIGIGAMPTTRVRWQLRAVDAYAQVGEASNSVTTGTAVPAPPGAPTGLTGRIVNGATLLGWTDAGPASTYRVSVDGSVVATPSTAGVTLPAPAVGASRTYEVAVVDGYGQPGPTASTTVTRTLTVPAAPAMATPTVSPYGTVTVRWQEPESDGGSPVTGYTVHAWKDGAVASTATAGADTGSAALTGLTVGRTYTVTVTATNAVGAGSPSAPVDVVPLAVPTAPLLGSITAGDGSAVVRWSAPTSDGGTPITGYKLEARLSSTYALVASTTAAADATSATLTGLANGTSYTVYVYALNASGTGSATTRTGVLPRPAPAVPAAPLLGAVSRANGAAVVRWAPPADDGGSPVTGYVVRTFQGSTQLATTTAAADATIANVLGLTNGTAYTFSIAAVNAVGTGPDSSRSGPVTPAPTGTAPSAPVLGTVTAGDGLADVSWSAPSSDGGSVITGYTVLVFRNGVLERSAPAPAWLRLLTVAGLTNGTSYTFAVTATNAAGTSIASTSSAPVTPRVVSTAPGAPVVGSVTVGDGSVSVEWSAPEDDGGAPITGYAVEVWSYGSLWTSAVVPATPTRATLDGLVNGTPYTVVVAATNDAGTGPSSAPSAEVTPAVPPAVAPSAPAIGSPTTYQAAARVRWSAPVDDGGAPLTGYEVRAYRSGVLVKQVTAPAAATSAAVTGLTLGRAHTFTVAAVNAAGTGPESARSSAVTPRTVPGAPKMSSATATRKAVVVTWAAPVNNGGAAVSGYVVRTYTGGRLVKATTALATARSVTVTGLTAGRSYTFRVQAKNAVGGGAWSAASKAVTPKR